MVRSGRRPAARGRYSAVANANRRRSWQTDTQGYWRVHDRTALPPLRNTDLIFLDGEYLEIAPLARPILMLIPTAMFGPPEKVWSDKVETTVPGLVFTEHGKGRVAYVPWDLGGLYYRRSSEAHRGLIVDVSTISCLPGGR